VEDGGIKWGSEMDYLRGVEQVEYKSVRVATLTLTTTKKAMG
jgi:hypothetical protein